MSITPWTHQSGENSQSDGVVSVCSRILTFTHPIKSAMGMGPSEARTTRRQLFRRFHQLGMTVENKTAVEGIPAADAFFVHDFWKIAADGNDHVLLTVSFAPRFTKRTLFKNIIERSILKETKEWFAGYSKMVLLTLQSGDEIAFEQNTLLQRQTAVDETSLRAPPKWHRSLYPLAMCGILLLLLMFAVSVLQLLYVREAVAILRGEMLILRQENQRILLDLMGGLHCRE